MTIDLINKRLSGETLDDNEALALQNSHDLQALAAAARQIRDAVYAEKVTFSPKVFIPLTRLCRDVCHYCTFARAPRNMAPYLTIDEVLDIAKAGAAAGCHEALFTLGDKPELRYRKARAALDEMGFATTIDYVAAAAKAVLNETGLLPHVNPGVLTEQDYDKLRPVSASAGIMLESTSERLRARGGPHFGSPDKKPAVRLASIDAAGRKAVPFTTGILIGIGENRAERIEALLAIRDAHKRHGHIQEVIVQNFRAKADTAMAAAAEPAVHDLAWTIAVARLVLAPQITVQAPPNLSPGALNALLEAGINDWGGVSPVTPDHVNPEAPWPHLEALRKATELAGKRLVPRLPIYPAFAAQGERWLDRALRAPVLRRQDSEGYGREDLWQTGTSTMPGALLTAAIKTGPAIVDGARAELARILDDAMRADGLDETQVEQLLKVRGSDVSAVANTADRLRAELGLEAVTYVVNRNINYTNVCTYHCRFCAFSKGKTHEALRGKPYDLELEEIARRAQEAWQRGGTEVCLQGGIHPDYTGQHYLNVCHTIKEAVPQMHIHAFSPLEITQGAKSLGLDLERFLRQLKAAGLSSLPGTAAEILDDEVRDILCPDKLSTHEWFAVMRAAHAVGLRSTATIMFGHVDKPVHWAKHLSRIGSLQAQTGGFTEFVPLPFVAPEAPIFRRGQARKGPTFREALLIHCVARLAFGRQLRNIQTSWVKMGPQGAAVVLQSGANDLGGTLMNESITRAAGAAHGQEFPPHEMEALIRSTGRSARQRTTFYADAPEERRAKAASAAPLRPVVNTQWTGSRRVGR
ncbi:MAG: 5-amino-6-(D-ribitylamino)uracil--L-tyrosine 4-hydroxyphenyl transferase CofH [Gammaproteobacteria bacterium]|nr:5-amino-6-(D-ribitylamino)uracil--L-tyrosine 4-hydroxyphenyl transferase CofH [Gammaproteobacteria bacterium]